ncbi:Rne/Rng family ribonuclease [Paenibacillus tarimensis]
MKQMLLHGGQNCVQAAVMTDGRLIEFYNERSSGKQWVGNVYKGRVVNVLPGMQAAFVDIGQGKNAFLYIDDMLHPNLERQPKDKPSISELLKTGQEVIVQVMKEPLGGKGARVTTHYSLPGRYLVYMPNAGYVGVSRKIGTEQERARLRQIGESICGEEEGVIMRTIAESVDEQSLRHDAEQLREKWKRVEAMAASAPVPSELYCDADLLQRVIRDMLTTETDEIWIDHPALFEETVAIVSQMAPSLTGRVRLYESGCGQPMFERYAVDEQLERAFEPRIRLASGGDLVCDQTEALTVIDVNTGKFTGHHDLEDTVFRTNLEAADEIARLLRLRDIGGIIIIDFIDMEQEQHRELVKQRLEQLIRQDRTKCHVVGWTRLGLLEMTRKKSRENIMNQLAQPCEACKGKGKIYISLSRSIYT